MQLAAWQQFVVWQRNIQQCDQRTAQLLQVNGFELFSAHLLFSLSLFPSPVPSVSPFPPPCLISSFHFLLIYSIPPYLPCAQSVKPLFQNFSSLGRADCKHGNLVAESGATTPLKRQEQQETQKYSCKQEYPPKHLNPQDGSCLDIWGGRNRAGAQQATKKQKQQHLQWTENMISINSYIIKLTIIEKLYSLFKFEKFS